MILFSPTDTLNSLIERFETKFKKPCVQWSALEIIAFIEERKKQERKNSDSRNENFIGE